MGAPEANAPAVPLTVAAGWSGLPLEYFLLNLRLQTSSAGGPLQAFLTLHKRPLVCPPEQSSVCNQPVDMTELTRLMHVQAHEVGKG